MNLQELLHHILKNYEPNELEEVLVSHIQGLMDAHEERAAALRSILTDPVNQLEVTKGGYYIYRFDLETMHRIADALVVEIKPNNHPLSVLASYTPEELTRLIC